ncbi:MAG: hypothetical protein LBU43_11070 [Candidatus Accumulibacter sp.]|jgi:hypothetical protein|nr:hypothetical protein [Accumulibacter sp.]
MTTKRIPDTNGWIEIKDNPLSKVGIFKYNGAVIGGHDGLDPYALYKREKKDRHRTTLDADLYDQNLYSTRILPLAPSRRPV